MEVVDEDIRDVRHVKPIILVPRHRHCREKPQEAIKRKQHVHHQVRHEPCIAHIQQVSVVVREGNADVEGDAVAEGGGWVCVCVRVCVHACVCACI